MNFVSNFFGAVAQYFNNDSDDTPTGAEAVVTDYVERQNLSDHAKETIGEFAEVDHDTIEGFFNNHAVANIKIGHDYGTYTVTVGVEGELPEFMDSLNLEVEDLTRLVEDGQEIPLIRDGGEWRIKWEELAEWDLFSPDDEETEDSE